VSSGDFHAFLWSDGVFTDLGEGSTVWGMNNAGVVAGTASIAGTAHATTWLDGVTTLLPDAAGGGRSGALDVNARGSVVGFLGL
jgi:uncharacterized membrane protein